MLKRTVPKKKRFRRQSSQSGHDLCWRLKQKYDRYIRTGARIGACQEVGAPDAFCPLFGKAVYRAGRLGRNRACTACGRYWIS